MGNLAVVTGASSGIGAATAELLASKGWTVVVVARRRERLEGLAQKFPGKVLPEALDAADGEAVLAMARRVVEAHGAPDLVVNSAGAGVWRWVEDTTPAMAAEMMGAPYLAAFNTTHAFLPSMLAARKGVFVHIGSPASLRPWASSAGYTASRWALRALNEVLDLDLRGTGVSSCHLLLGEVSSEYFEANPGSHDYIPRIGAIIPLITPQEAAEAVLRVAASPTRETYHPFMLRVVAWFDWGFPWVMRELVAATGRKRG